MSGDWVFAWDELASVTVLELDPPVSLVLLPRVLVVVGSPISDVVGLVTLSVSVVTAVVVESDVITTVDMTVVGVTQSS